MTRHHLVLTKQAQKELLALPRDVRLAIEKQLVLLAENPKSPALDIKALRGDLLGLLRLRVGRYRIIYRVDSGAITIVVVHVWHRKEAY